MALPKETQQQLMSVINDLMPKQTARTATDEIATAAAKADPDTTSSRIVALCKDVERLTSERDSVTKRFSQLTTDSDSIKQDNALLLKKQDELLSMIKSLEGQLAAAQKTSAVPKHAETKEVHGNLLLNLGGGPQDLASQQLQEELDSRDRTIVELKKKVEESAKATQEVRRLRDELDIMRERAAEAMASEERVNRLKKKLEETADLQHRLKTLEEENQAHLKRAAEMDDAAGKLATLRAQLDSSKQKLLQQTTQLADLTMVIARKDLEVQRANEHAERAAKEVQVAQEQIHKMESQLREAKESAEMAPQGLMVLPRSPNDTFMLDSPASPTSHPDLRDKVAQLEAENKRMTAALGSNARVAELENRLDDSEKLNERFQQELASLSRRLVETEAGRGVALKNDVDAKANAARTEELTKRVRQLEAENKQYLADIDGLVRQSTSLKQAAPAVSNEELRDLTSKLRVAEEKVSKLAQEKAQVEAHLQAAKLIIKEERSKGASHEVEKVQSAHEEVIRTLQSQLREKDRDYKLLKQAFDEGRDASAKEQKLLLASFYEVGLELARTRTKQNPLTQQLRAAPSAPASPTQLDATSFLARKRAQSRKRT